MFLICVFNPFLCTNNNNNIAQMFFNIKIKRNLSVYFKVFLMINHLPYN